MGPVIVQPRRQRDEALFVLVATIAIILIAAAILTFSGKSITQPKLRSYQISAIDKLGPNDLNIFTDLYGQATEVERLHFTNGEVWPKLNQLENDYIPPFVKDAIWEKRGKLQWAMFPTDRDEIHTVAYVGRSSSPEIASSFILLFEHFHTLDGAYYIGVNKEKAFTIWVKPGSVTIPSDFSQGALIKDGWFQVMAYTGSDELKKMNRGQ